MSQGLPEWAHDTADAEAAEQPREPAVLTPEGVTAQVRRRRRALVLVSVGVVLAYVVFVAALSLVWRAWPTVYAWVLLAVVLVLTAGSLWLLRSHRRDVEAKRWLAEPLPPER